MSLPIALISTDFDGTLYSEIDEPPVAASVVEWIGSMKDRGAKWVINTGRDMPSILEGLARADIEIQPDYLVLVEREIYALENNTYTSVNHWNTVCTQAHQGLFSHVESDISRLTSWINGRFDATVYEDDYSPFCLIARNNPDMDAMESFLKDYSREVPNLTVVRNDIYLRFSHGDFNKGTALSEISRLLGLTAEQVFAVGDQLNDLPMLSRQHAHWLAAPANALDVVKDAVLSQGGYVSLRSCGHGVAEALSAALEKAKIL